MKTIKFHLNDGTVSTTQVNEDIWEKLCNGDFEKNTYTSPNIIIPLRGVTYIEYVEKE